MALVIKDRVRETTTSVGLGPVTFLGAATGHQAFSSIGDGNDCYYCETDGTNWEVGAGRYTLSTNSMTRIAIWDSSNGGAAVNWGPGTKDIFITAPGMSVVQMQANSSLFVSGKPAIVAASPVVLTCPTTSATLARTDAAQAFSGTQGFKGLVALEGGVSELQSTQTGATYTVADGDIWMLANVGGTITYTLPNPVTSTGRRLGFRTITANAVVSAGSNVSKNGVVGTSILDAYVGSWAILQSNGTNWQIVANSELASLAASGDITQTRLGGMWEDIAPFVNIARFDRVFVGAACVNDGKLTNVVDDWLEALNGNTTSNTQLAATSPFGLIGVLGGSQSVDFAGANDGCIVETVWGINNNITL